MRIDFKGKLVDEPEIRAGFIGCGSHSFRNIYPTFQFAPVNLVATCDLEIDKARAFAKKFGAEKAYSDYHEMLDKEELDGVFVVTGYDPTGRPLYPKIAVDCLNAGVNVWIEKPPASSCAEIERMRGAAKKSGKFAMAGLKKMFFPANEKAKELMETEDFGSVSMATFQYPQRIPTQEVLQEYIEGGPSRDGVHSFLDHLCHPMSTMLFLLGMPETLFYQRHEKGAGIATFTFASGTVASLLLTFKAGNNVGGMERTMLVSGGEKNRHILVENNTRVSYHRGAGGPYGATPSFYSGKTKHATAMWEPEFSLGQLYNKGLFLLGYYGEVNEFARAISEERQPSKGTLEQAWQATRVFEAFAEGPGKVITL